MKVQAIFNSQSVSSSKLSERLAFRFNEKLLITIVFSIFLIVCITLTILAFVSNSPMLEFLIQGTFIITMLFIFSLISNS